MRRRFFHFSELEAHFQTTPPRCALISTYHGSPLTLIYRFTPLLLLIYNLCQLLYLFLLLNYNSLLVELIREGSLSASSYLHYHPPEVRLDICCHSYATTGTYIW